MRTRIRGPSRPEAGAVNGKLERGVRLAYDIDTTIRAQVPGRVAWQPSCFGPVRKMSMKNHVILFALASIALAAVAPASPARAQAPAAALAPGRYKDWHGNVDELEVLQPFRAADYRRVVVLPIDGTGVKLPADETAGPTKAALAGATGPFVQGMQKRLSKDARIQVEQGSGSGGAAASGAGTVLIRARLTKLNPGSRAARYWGGFGAGAAEAAVTGEALDGRTGRPLFRFVQQRRSGTGVLGGDYLELMNRSLNEIGGDVASVLAAAR